MADGQLINLEPFASIDLSDPFFDSLKLDYPGFDTWFTSKAASTSSQAFTFRHPTTKSLDGFLYLKPEDGAVSDVSPPLPPDRRLKVGTFKVNPHGTRLGERFLKRAFDTALSDGRRKLYVTIFPKHGALVELFAKYGFTKVATKGGEEVLERNIDVIRCDTVLDYPRIPLSRDRHFVLSLYPSWHSRLLPDSLLKTESTDILLDVSHTNSIQKIYLAAMQGIDQLRRGDTLLIYRTSDGGPAYYTSVITSLCVTEELLHISSFATEEAFIEYCRPYSVFTTDELRGFFRKRKYPWLIRFTYNMALTKRPNRKALLEDVGLDANQYWGFFQISTDQLKEVLKISGDYAKASTLVYSS